MGCQSSMCTETDELLLSQQLDQKLSDQTSSISEKSTGRVGSSSPKHFNFQAPFRSLNLARSVVKLLLKDLPNFAEIVHLTDIWVAEIQSFLKFNSLSPEDLKTKISFDSSGKIVVIKHEIDGSRDYSIIKSVCEKVGQMKGYGFDIIDYKQKAELLNSLCPLAVSVYLKLGPEIDLSIGVDKPLDLKKTNLFLGDCEDFKVISTWQSLDNHPIATFCYFSMINQSKFINFCIFDGLKMQNIDKALTLLEGFGAPVGQEIQEFLRKNNADEMNCCLEIAKNKVVSISLEIKTEDMGEGMLDIIESSYDLQKWNTFHSIVQPKFFAVELNSAGYSLKKISSL